MRRLTSPSRPHNGHLGTTWEIVIVTIVGEYSPPAPHLPLTMLDSCAYSHHHWDCLIPNSPEAKDAEGGAGNARCRGGDENGDGDGGEKNSFGGGRASAIGQERLVGSGEWLPPSHIVFSSVLI